MKHGTHHCSSHRLLSHIPLRRLGVRSPVVDYASSCLSTKRPRRYSAGNNPPNAGTVVYPPQSRFRVIGSLTSVRASTQVFKTSILAPTSSTSSLQVLDLSPPSDERVQVLQFICSQVFEIILLVRVLFTVVVILVCLPAFPLSLGILGLRYRYVCTCIETISQQKYSQLVADF